MTNHLHKPEYPRYVACRIDDDIAVICYTEPRESSQVLQITPEALVDLVRVKADIKGLHRRLCWSCQKVH